jgi:hypothetical protein
MSNEIESNLMQQKADYFFKNKKAVHVKYKKGFFKNGEIIEISSDFFMLNDFLEGEFPVFFLEIEEIELYTTKGEGSGAGKRS